MNIAMRYVIMVLRSTTQKWECQGTVYHDVEEALNAARAFLADDLKRNSYVQVRVSKLGV